MLTILHTNDFHNKLSPAQRAHLQQRRHEREGSVLLLDAGDAIGAGNVTFRPGGEPILEQMSAIGYDAMTVGNREFHFSRVGFHCKLACAGFPILCANIRPSRKEARETALPQDARQDAKAEGVFCASAESVNESVKTDPPVRPYLLKTTANGWRVAIFGVTVPMITERMVVRKASAYVFDDPLSIAAELVPRIREECRPDMLIALTHIGIKHDRLLAESVPGIDLIIGGHTHVVLETGERVGQTLLVQAGSHGRFLGIVEAERDDDAGLSLTARLEPL